MSAVSNQVIEREGLRPRARADYINFLKSQKSTLIPDKASLDEIFVSSVRARCPGCESEKQSYGDEGLVWAFVIDRARPQLALMHDTKECRELAGGKMHIVETWKASVKAKVENAQATERET